MAKSLAKTGPSGVAGLIQSMNLRPVSLKDEIDFSYSARILTVTVKREDGLVETVRRSVTHSGFAETTIFDPSKMTTKERNQVVYGLADKRLSQSEISRRTGIPQTTVSNILRKRP